MENQNHAHHSEQVKLNLKSRLNRIEGQVKAINRMIDEDVYCDDVLLEHHMKSCIMEKINQGTEEEAMEELLVTFQKLVKD